MQPHAQRAATLMRSVLVTAGLAAGIAHGQSSKTIPDFGAIFPGQVNAMEEASGVLYVGGSFQAAYQPSGNFAILNKSTGLPLAFPRVEGTVDCLAPDGAGGWFIGGSFTQVGGFARAGAAHILADGRLSDWWSPIVAGGAVLAIQPAGAWVYLGGSFTSVGGFGRNRLARVSIATGGVDPGWNPNADGSVQDLDVAGNVLYAVGEFLNLGPTARGRAAAFDVVTGALDPNWNPNADAIVRVVRGNLAGTGIYLGGDFSVPSTRLAIVQPAGGANTGASLGWGPTFVGNGVYGLVELSGKIYFGGDFNDVNSSTRKQLAAVDAFPAPAALAAWNPDPVAALIYFVETDGIDIYTGGELSAVNGGAVTRRGVVALPAGGTGLPPIAGWDPSAALIDAGDAAQALAINGNSVAVGGSFDGFGYRDRDRLAAFDVSTGNLTSWWPRADNSVEALDAFGGAIYLGGRFGFVNGTSRTGLAAVDNTAGGLLGWAPALTGGSAFALVVDAGGSVFVGGDFTGPRNQLAKFMSGGGLDTGFSAGALNGQVNSLALFGSFLHVGGTFTTIGASPRNRLAAVNSTSGALDPWDPDANGNVRDMAGATRMYFGGDFTTVDTGPPVTRNRAAGTVFANGANTGQPPSTWNPNADLPVNAVQPLGNGDVALAGNFSMIAGSLRNRLASVDPTGGTPRTWDPSATGGDGTALAVGPKRLYAGGTFEGVGGQKRHGLAAFCLTNQPGSLAATPGGNNTITLTWAGAAPSYNVYRATRSGGPYTLLGNVASVFYVDNTAQGGVPYFYAVKGLDGCESDPSNMSTAAAIGGCGAAPEFEGVAGATPSPAPLCGTTLVWAPAATLCGTGLRYSVYRSTNQFFTPDISNRLVAGLGGTTYTDTSNLVGGGTQYYYVVRAQHDSNGQEDQNLIRLGVMSPTCTLTSPEPVHVFTVTSRDSENVLDWLRPTIGYNQTVVRVCTVGSPGCVGGVPQNSGDGNAVTTVIGGAGQPFKFGHAPVANDQTYKYAAFAQDATFTDAMGAKSFGRPASTALFFKWGFATGASALTPVGVLPNNRYVVVSNDRTVHAVGAGASAPESGNWPTGWKPFAMNGPAQARPTIVTIGGTPTAFVSSQDGHLYAVNANTGGLIWDTGALGASIQASASVRVGAPNLVFVGTRDLNGSWVFGLNYDAQNTQWIYNADELARPLGIISGQPALELVTSRLYFGSRAKGGGSPHTVWCLPFTGGPAVWTRNLEDVDAAVAVFNGRVYVGTTNGRVYALNMADGTDAWTVPFDTGTTQAIQDLVFPTPIDASNWRVYFTAGGRVFGLQETFATTAPTPFWPAGGIPIANASAPLVRLPRVYVGGGNSRLYSIDGNDPTPPAPDEVVLGDPGVPKILGRATFDTFSQLLLVGSDQGVVYSVAPFP